MNSATGGYGAADTFLDDRIDAIPQRTRKHVLLLAKRFTASYRLHVIDPKVRQSDRKIIFEKSDPLTEKNQNFTRTGFTGARLHVFVPTFAEIGKVKVIKRACGIHHEKVSIALKPDKIGPRLYY